MWVSTISHDRKKCNRRRLTKDSNVPSSAMKDRKKLMQVLLYSDACESVYPGQSGIQQKSWFNLIPARTISMEGFSPPLTPPPCNVPDTLIIKYMTVMLYTIILVFFYCFLFLCKNVSSKSTQSLSVSQHFFVFFVFEQFFVVVLARKWNIFYTTIDSPYLCRQVLWS